MTLSIAHKMRELRNSQDSKNVGNGTWCANLTT